MINKALNTEHFVFAAGGRGINYDNRQGKKLNKLNFKSLWIARYAVYIER